MNNKTYSFVDLFDLSIKTKNDISINSIEIPMIQRDYAQGRENDVIDRIRNNFIDALHSALIDNGKHIELDFIYGIVSDTGKLIPLDGQQRLTTLFLLHWYISKKEKILAADCDFLKNFFYKTRPSSSRFCEKLLENDPDFTEIKLSNWIKNQSWYLFAWEHDPTVSSMLVMIDEIHSRFNIENSAMWKKLVTKGSSPISFYFLNLEEDMGLSDSIYIKMNSRGELLTEFEHFKASLEGLLKKEESIYFKDFSQKVDNSWVDMLWSLYDFNQTDDVEIVDTIDKNTVDDKFIRYFRFISETLCFDNQIEIEKNILDLTTSLYSKKNNTVNKNFEFLFNAFDCWSNEDDISKFFLSIFSKEYYEEDKVVLFDDNTNLLNECCISCEFILEKRNFSLNDRILLYAVLIYKINEDKIPLDLFRERIRIVRNLVMNSSFEIRFERLGAIFSQVKDIIIYGNISLKTKDFNENQKKQELEKMKWKKNNLEFIPILYRLEDHRLLQGNVKIIDFESIESFSKRVDKFYAIFSEDSDYIKIGRALLTIGDYSQNNSKKFFLGGRNFANWRDLFTESNQRKDFTKTKNILEILIDYMIEHKESSLDSIIESYLDNPKTIKDWRYYLIKYPQMMSGNYGRYYRIIEEEPYNFIMMNTAASLSGRNWCPYFYQAMEDPFIKEVCMLGEYNNPLVIVSKQINIVCQNDSWLFLDNDNIEIDKFLIPQLEGYDLVDRVENLIELIKKTESL